MIVVMPGLVPGIHVFADRQDQDVDGPDNKPVHEGQVGLHESPRDRS
jgi:hypothetical protein